MKKLVLALVAAVFSFPVVAFATSYWSGPKWVANTANWHQLSYFGEAYTVKGYGGAQITYYRNNNYVGGAYAYVCVLQDLSTQYCKEKVHTFAPEIFL